MRSLYDCAHAKNIYGIRIMCAKGKILDHRCHDGCIDPNRAARGERLELRICQQCEYYEEMGDPLPPEEKGWL